MGTYVVVVVATVGLITENLLVLGQQTSGIFPLNPQTDARRSFLTFGATGRRMRDRRGRHFVRMMHSPDRLLGVVQGGGPVGVASSSSVGKKLIWPRATGKSKNTTKKWNNFFMFKKAILVLWTTHGHCVFVVWSGCILFPEIIIFSCY